ncbi:MAG: alanine dehydrogenase [Candidatus Bathyarchaeota archaeon]|nr:alanine dehydrogenase [Candidatus Bathyarchaeum sp.]
MKTLILSEEDIKNVISLDEVIVAVESAFKMKATGRTQMPPKQYIFIEKYNGDLRTMPAYLQETDVVTVKVVNSHPENRKYGLPTVMATIILVDPKTGVPKAIMGGTRITALRTGAAGAIAAKHLANPNPKTVGIVGAGTQARTQLIGLQTVFETIKEVKAWDLNEKAAVSYAKEMKAKYQHVNICSVKNVKSAVQDADIVVTATPSRKPLVSAEWINDGTHINCIGADAPGKQELDPAVLLKAKIVIDDWEQSVHGGEINVPFSKGIIKQEDVWGDICEIVAGLKAGRREPEEVTIFASTGLAIQDAAAANVAYTKALKEKIGKQVDILNN